ncbi:roadblock/LC7 domain-containing protein [Asanoa sp. WMMD1127]|uniref:roadblock/LC7 domain-containing protein n=1 Tax=Asanoa sp. WMMD1127 TaxID=3016107 RepID=UPI00241733A2|nr:roadblock/LC7 domain-containing protein [Asanoa sp. WMMD1127]MDG4827556.1 roadblock/LC7 domain-containing protein [Asanoa sp. WMMD1127]
MDTDRAIAAALRTLREVPDVVGSVLAGPDGLLIASDVDRVEPDTIAAMAAATVGLGRRFAETVGLGNHRETVIQADGGCLVSYAAGAALLTVVAMPQANLALVHRFARQVAQRLGLLVEALAAQPPPGRVPGPNPPPAPPAREPLPRRTTRTTAPGRPSAARS